MVHALCEVMASPDQQWDEQQAGQTEKKGQRGDRQLDHVTPPQASEANGYEPHR
jgi:hypothetical protein